MKTALFFIALFCSISWSFGRTQSVLFLGNSYTYVNDLPRMVSDLATSGGDTLFYDSNTIGGAYFYTHFVDAISQEKLKSHWDVVVLQGQSLELFGTVTWLSNPFPYAVKLDSMIHIYNPCSETMFFMTWGRENGISGYSYLTMDSMIHENYMNLAESLNAVVSPVGEVWKYIRQNYPSYELYEPDESHPSLAGSYAAAACFYSALFRKDPVNCTFNSTLQPDIALNIRMAARNIVYNHLSDWHIGEHDAQIKQCLDSSVQAMENGAWTIYPNPATGSLTLNFENGHFATMQLYNAQGILIREIQPSSGREKIDISSLPEGLYIMNRKGESEGKKFIKQ